MNLNENALDYLVDDLDNLNLNDNSSVQGLPKERDDISQIYSEHSKSSVEKSVVSHSEIPFHKNNDDISSNMSSDMSSLNTGTGSERNEEKIVENIPKPDTPANRANMLKKINARIQRGFTTTTKCTINTPLSVLDEEYLYQGEFIKHKESLDSYKGFINTSVRTIEYLSGWVPIDSFDIDLTGLHTVWTKEENQSALDDIVESLEMKYGSIEFSPELKLGMMLFKTILLVTKLNRAGKQTETVKTKAEPKTKKRVLKPPSAAIRKKITKTKTK